jgi:uncharacterized membrane protein YqjE
MATGKGSKRSEQPILLDDTDEEEKQQQQPSPRIAVNKRRRTILDDDDDDDEVEFVSQTLAGNSNRLVIFIYLSHINTMFRRFALDSNTLYIIIKTMDTYRLQSNNNIDSFTIFILNFIIPPVNSLLHLDRTVLYVLQVVPLMLYMRTMSPSVIHPSLDVEAIGQVRGQKMTRICCYQRKQLRRRTMIKNLKAQKIKRLQRIVRSTILAGQRFHARVLQQLQTTWGMILLTE